MTSEMSEIKRQAEHRGNSPVDLSGWVLVAIIEYVEGLEEEIKQLKKSISDH